MKNIYICAYILLITVLFVPYSVAQNIPQNYESYSKYADKIVRGKVVGSRLMTYDDAGTDKPCGVFMEIEVTKSWRGGSDNFLIYSTSGDIYLTDDQNREYIIYAFKNKHYQPSGQAREYILCEGDRSYMRNIAPFEYINNSQIQHMFPLRKEEETDQEWMLVMVRDSNAVLPESIEKHSVNGENQSIIEEMNLEQFMTAFIPEN